LHLRVYYGREIGLMVVGTAEALTHLGTQLQAAATVNGDARIPGWPPVIACPTVAGPYINEPHFQLSFHVMPAAGLPKSLPLRRRGIPIVLSLVLGVLALIGAVAAAMWFAQ
jgi:hypothetical protein